MFGLRPAYPEGLHCHEILHLVQKEELKPIPLTLTEATCQEIVDLTNSCLEFDPLDRPSFEEIEAILSPLVNTKKFDQFHLDESKEDRSHAQHTMRQTLHTPSLVRP